MTMKYIIRGFLAGTDEEYFYTGMWVLDAKRASIDSWISQDRQAGYQYDDRDLAQRRADELNRLPHNLKFSVRAICRIAGRA